MADRSGGGGGAPSRPTAAGGISKYSRPGLTSTGSSSSSVRRNLFQSQLTRRPTAGSVSSSSTTSTAVDNTNSSSSGNGNGSNNSNALRLDADLQLQPPDSASASPVSLDIVVRDKNGEIELGDPPTPVSDDMDDGALDSRQEGEKERQRLAEAVKQHQIDQNSMPAQPEGETQRHAYCFPHPPYGLVGMLLSS